LSVIGARYKVAYFVVKYIMLKWRSVEAF